MLCACLSCASLVPQKSSQCAAGSRAVLWGRNLEPFPAMTFHVRAECKITAKKTPQTCSTKFRNLRINSLNGHLPALQAKCAKDLAPPLGCWPTSQTPVPAKPCLSLLSARALWAPVFLTLPTQPLCWALPDFCLNLLCLIGDYPKYHNRAQIWQFSWALE